MSRDILRDVLATLAAFLAVSAVVICTPGQDTALTIRNTLAGGRRNGIATAFGVACGQAVWTLAASAGLVALLGASEPVFHALKLFGGLYLVYLGMHSLRRAVTREASDDASASEAPRRRRGFRQGVLSNLGNPKMAVFFATLLPQFAREGAFLPLLALGLLFCSLTFAWLTLYAVAVSKARNLIRGRVRQALDTVTGLVLSALGLRLALEPRAAAQSAMREAPTIVSRPLAVRTRALPLPS
jgi:threonine/homoserine/homoserine lactone efflux protein